MEISINLPTFNKRKSYENLRQELLAWSEITDISKSKQGIVIALSLSENDETQISDKMFDQISIDDLKSDDGLRILLNFLDQHLGKDDLMDSLEKNEDFDTFQRTERMSIHEYIALFDAKYRKIEKKRVVLPSEILAFVLLRKANITREEKLLVLTGMNFENNSTLYEDAKKSLKKFKCNGGESGSGSRSSIKLEPAYKAVNKESLLAGGYIRATIIERNVGGGKQTSCKRWKAGEAYTRNKGNQRIVLGSSLSKNGIKMKINPTGSDGHIITFKSCGSFRHLLNACRDSWENMAKTNT